MKKLIMMAIAFAVGTASIQAADTDIAAMDNALFVKGTTVAKGQTAQLSLELKNALTNVQSVGAYITLPAGVTATAATLESRADLTPTKTGAEANTVQINTVDGVTRLALLGCSGEAFTGSEGAIVTLDVTVSEDAVAGDYDVKVSNTELCTLDSKATNITSDVVTTLNIIDGKKGDLNKDGNVDIEDLAILTNIMCGSAPVAGSDLNNDGTVDIEDLAIMTGIMCGN